MNFGANKTPAKVIEESAFEDTYFKDIYSGVNEKWYRKSWKELDQLKDIDQKYYCSNYCDVNINKYGVKRGALSKLWENERYINGIDPYGWLKWYFRYWLGGRSLEDKRQINRWKQIISRFWGKLVKMIKDAADEFDDYSISSKIRQIYCIEVMN